MAEKQFSNVRIIHKHDTESNWLKATGFTPKQGELIVYDVDENYNYERIKIGDGVQNVNDLPFETNRSLKVTVSRDDNDNNVVDKTYQEIYDAVFAGAYVYMITRNTLYVDFNSIWPNTILWLSYCSDYSVIFSHQDGSSEYEVEIDSDGKVSLYYSSSLPSQYSYGYEGMVLTVGEDGFVNPADFPDTIARTADVDEVKALVGDTSVSDQIADAISEQVGDHLTDTTKHITAEERAKWEEAYEYSQGDHAPSDAEKNQNAYGQIIVNNSIFSANSIEDSIVFSNTAGVTINAKVDTVDGKDVTNIEFGNAGVRSVETGTANGTISVNTGGTVADVPVKGLGSAAYTESSAYDASGSASTALTNAKKYTDEKMTELVGDTPVATQIENALAGFEGGDSFSGSWDDITDKPFSAGDIAITWDGDLAGMAYVGQSDNRYYRISDSVVKACDFIEGNASLSVVDAALNTPITEQIPLNNVREEDGILVVGDYNIISVPNNNMILSINYDTVTFPSAGTYFRYIPDAFYISILRITKTTGKILSENLPDGVSSKAELTQHRKNSTWTQIYNSGSTTKNVNAFSGIDIDGYTKIKVAIKCVNVTASAGTTAGSIIFTGEDGMDYSFSSLFGNLITNTSGTAGAMAEFTIVDGFIICDNALRSTSAVNMLSNESGQGAYGLTSVGGGLIACDVPVYAMKIATANLSTTHYYGKGSKVIVWGCKE